LLIELAQATGTGVVGKKAKAAKAAKAGKAKATGVAAVAAVAVRSPRLSSRCRTQILHALDLFFPDLLVDKIKI
jgi:hypothetical protein